MEKINWEIQRIESSVRNIRREGNEERRVRILGERQATSSFYNLFNLITKPQ